MLCCIMMVTWRIKCCFAVKINNYTSVKKVPYLLLCSKFVFQFCVAMLHSTISCLWPFVWSTSRCSNQECDKPVFRRYCAVSHTGINSWDMCRLSSSKNDWL